jgi:protein-tyrosine phosphatase
MSVPGTPAEMQAMKKAAMPPKITSVAQFANARFELILEPGVLEKNAVLKGYTDKISLHDGLVIAMKAAKKEAKISRRAFEDVDKVAEESHGIYVSMSMEAPEEEELDVEAYIMHILKKNEQAKKEKRKDKILPVPSPEEVQNMLDEQRLMKEKIRKAEEKYLNDRGIADRAKRYAATKFSEFAKIAKDEKIARNEVTADHRKAKETGVTVMELFPKVHIWDVLVSINHASTWNIPFEEIMEMLKEEVEPHRIEFAPYLFRQNVITGKWASFAELRKKKMWAPDQRVPDNLFIESARMGDIGTIRSMIEHGHDAKAGHIDNTDETGSTALHYAAVGGHLDVCELLLEEKAKPNIANWNGKTPFFMCVARGCLKGVKRFVDFQSDVNTVDKTGKSVLMRAIMSGKEELVDFLLEHGADYSVQDGNRWTMLHYAARSGSKYLTQRFLDFGISPYLKTKGGKTPAKLSEEAGQSHIVAFIEQHIFHEPAQLIDDYWGGQVWLGSIEAGSRKWATQRGIQAILSIKQSHQLYNTLRWLEDNDAVAAMQELVITDHHDHSDKPWKELVKHLLKMSDFIHKQLMEKKVLLIHCDQGHNISATVLIHYMMTKRQMAFKDALAHIQSIRHHIHLQPSFLNGLQEFEEKVHQIRLERIRNKVRESVMISQGF